MQAYADIADQELTNIIRAILSYTTEGNLITSQDSAHFNSSQATIVTTSVTLGVSTSQTIRLTHVADKFRADYLANDDIAE